MSLLETARPRAGRRPRAAPEPPAQDSARAFLDKQARMLDIQMEHLHEQRALILSHLRLRRLNEGFKVALQVLACIVGAAVVGAIALMAVQAWRSKGVVIEPISAPAELAQRGLDGASLSALLLDKLRALQAATDSARAADSYSHSWGDDIKLEIPDTGVSVGELQQYLRRWLGRETHISGELYRGLAPGAGAPAPLSLTVRAGERPGATLQGSEASVDALVESAAESLYAQTQPYRWCIYLTRHGRMKEAGDILARLAATGSAEERAWADTHWGAVLIQLSGDIAAGQSKYRAALELDPNLAIARDDLAGLEIALGHDGPAIMDLKHEVELLSGGRDGELAAAIRPVIRTWAQVRIAAAEGDYATAAAQVQAMQLLSDYQDSAGAALLEEAAALALLHDVGGARAVLASAGPPDPAKSFVRSADWGSNLIPELAIDRASDDWPAAVRDLAAAQAAASDPLIARVQRSLLWPWLAYARARTGDMAGAQALIAATPLDAYPALLGRGRIAALARDWPAAEHWFAAAARAAPELPAAYLAWGEMRLAKGDADGAIDRLRKAHALAPRFADPLEAWGRARLLKRDAPGAADRFAAALALAPKWDRARAELAAARRGS